MTDIAKLAIELNTSDLVKGSAAFKNLQRVGDSTAKTVIRNTNGMAQGFQAFGEESRRAANSILKLASQESKLVVQQNKLAATTAKLSAATTAEEKAVLRAQQAQEQYAVSLTRTQIAASQASGTVSNNSKALADATPKMKGFGNSARQASMQLSQVAQQGSVTGNFLQALAIQLPDLALGFGTLGILIGAAAGALAIFFINSAKKAEKASDELSESIDGLVDSYEDLGQAQRELLRLQIAEETKNLTKENKLLAADTSNLVTVFDSLARQYERGSIGVVEYNEKTAQVNKTLRENRAEIEANNKTIKDRNDVLSESVKKEEALAEAGKLASDARASLSDRETGRLANIQAQQESLAKAQRTQLETVRDTAMEEKAILANSYSENIIDLEEYRRRKQIVDDKFATDSLAATQREQSQRNQILTAGQQASLSIIGGLFGQMAAIAQQGGEKQFQAYKNLATAQALISTSLAVANTLANPLLPPPLNFGLAATVGTLGAIQVGMIQNQQFQGTRAMGGQVEAGGRFLVGENGPEVLQLGGQGGSITPNHALDTDGGARVTTIVNIQAGVTKAEVTSLIPAIVNASVNSVKAEMSSGGTMSRSIGRRA